jgi:beta-phosphoglucomutase-like phosphatase (HAD superfamily)
MPDVVLLEWEGVLVDTASMRRDAIHCALEDERCTDELTRLDEQLAGLGTSAAANRLFVEDPVLADLVADRAERRFLERLAQGFVLQPGARAFVERAQSGARLAIVTRATHAETEVMLRLSDLGDAIATIVCADDVLDHSPAAAQYERVLALLGRLVPVQRSRSVALVDATPSVRAARAAAVRVITVGAEPHVALDADGAVASLEAVDLAALAALLGLDSARQQPS